MDVITVDQIAPFTSMRWIPEGNVTALHSFSLLSPHRQKACRIVQRQRLAELMWPVTLTLMCLGATQLYSAAASRARDRFNSEGKQIARARLYACQRAILDGLGQLYVRL
ncbi:hypothetical protein HAP41_0000044290 [Bradyrhizobium barranii subsp. apii]|uniref:Uncharacterized protein n=1 Tax=Bradyrhizobium barranii subsp. apii TaxID=2819348 RepID=A0A8T5V633_9BRAD|nr:hypothetical protein [Bradyrhizobium barranii]UPT87133.1 hypothetical protein HAP41_0000044290 [Bradyrhizobium barranii subsp. apii]UPT96266.1 hypothetical protein J4G48_0045830 [Bradyrhizobium barranii subsp. apii]